MQEKKEIISMSGVMKYPYKTNLNGGICNVQM